MAVSLFRSFTEFHTFFNCNTVKKSVIDQTTRTTFGKFVMLFQPHSTIGEMYLFDILRTRRQAYTRAWSILNEQLYTNQRRNQSQRDSSENPDFRPVQSPLANRRSGTNDDIVIDITKTPRGKFTTHENLNELSSEELKRIVRDLEDSRICQVCMKRLQQRSVLAAMLFAVQSVLSCAESVQFVEVRSLMHRECFSLVIKFDCWDILI